jgi:hypothetical protein
MDLLMAPSVDVKQLLDSLLETPEKGLHQVWVHAHKREGRWEGTLEFRTVGHRSEIRETPASVSRSSVDAVLDWAARLDSSTIATLFESSAARESNPSPAIASRN